MDGEDDIELETDDVSKTTDEGGSVTHDPSQTDLPVITPIPGQIVQPQVDEVGPDTPIGDIIVVKGDNNTDVADEEGAGQPEQDGASHVDEEGANTVEEGANTVEAGASHVDEEGANTNAENGHDETEHNAGITQGGYNQRPNRFREYSHRFDPQVYSVTNVHAAHTAEPTTPVAQRLFGFVFTQMSARAGIKKHGQSARDALTAEFAQLDYKGAYEPVRATDLAEAQQTKALRIINLIKEKRNGCLKGRSVADGRPQCELYTKDETSSPTATPESVLLAALIDAVEDRHVAVVDVTGTNLNADMDDFVLIRLLGDDVDMMCNANPTYAEFVSYEKGWKMLFLQLKKALYGCVKSALLWYRLFRDTLQDLGFVLNLYDPCVANAQIKGSQCTIVWYMDDNKISHKEQAVVNDIIQHIEAKFGPMTKMQGDDHEFLGMQLHFNRVDKTVKILMQTYLDEAIHQSQLDMRRAAATPATKTLFEIDPNAAPLGPPEFDRFCSVVCKLLYVALRGRPNILLAVVFLASHVSKATLQDQAKLKRLLEYLYGTYDLPLILGA